MNGNSTFTWFKLPTALITQPKFQRLSPIAQAGYITLCCVYWQDSGVMTYEDAQMNAEGVDELIERGYIQSEEGLISISFLDEQIDEVEQLRNKKKAAGVKSAQARAKQKGSTSSTPVQHEFNTCSTDKNKIKEKEKEKREQKDIERETRVNADSLEKEFLEVEEFEEIENFDQTQESQKEKVPPKRKRFEPPTEAEVQLFFQATESPDSWEAYYNYYLANGWRVGKNPMKDWQAAARNWLHREKTYINSKPNYNGKEPAVTDQLKRNLANSILNGDFKYD
jgi:HD superfamily phosphohydrolase